MHNDWVFYLTVALIPILTGGLVTLALFSAWAVLQEYRRDRVPALLYHQLISSHATSLASLTGPNRSYIVYDSAFAEQMAYLHAQGYSTISVSDLLAFQEGKISLPTNPIMITFDDGFASNYHYAFPILKKYGMTATVFATPDRDCENFRKHAATDKPLTHAQMREMNDCGISIQSHGMTHRYLTELQSDTIRWELTQSKKTLETILATPVEYLAIPSGAYNRTVKKLAKEAGYKAVFCMLKGTNNKGSDRYALRRLVIGQDLGLREFCRILRPPAAWYLRMTSSVQMLLLYLLGPMGLDMLRNVIYGSRLGSALTRRSFSGLISSITAVAILTLALSVIWLFQNDFLTSR